MLIWVTIFIITINIISRGRKGVKGQVHDLIRIDTPAVGVWLTIQIEQGNKDAYEDEGHPLTCV